MSLLTLGIVGVVGAATNSNTYTVNSTKDEVDKTPGDNICAHTPWNVCTLCMAVMESNAHAGTDTVSLGQTTYKLTISGRDGNTPNAAKGDLDILDDTNLYGLACLRRLLMRKNWTACLILPMACILDNGIISTQSKK